MHGFNLVQAFNFLLRGQQLEVGDQLVEIIIRLLLPAIYLEILVHQRLPEINSHNLHHLFLEGVDVLLIEVYLAKPPVQLENERVPLLVDLRVHGPSYVVLHHAHFLFQGLDPAVLYVGQIHQVIDLL